VTVYTPVPPARGQATDSACGCRSQCTAMCSAWFASAPQGKWLRRTLNQATAASHMLSSPFFTDPIARYYVMVCGRPSHFIYDHLFTSIQGGSQQTAASMQRLLPVTLIHTPRPLTRWPNLVVQRRDRHVSPSSPRWSAADLLINLHVGLHAIIS